MRLLRGAIDCAVVLSAIGALGVALTAHQARLSHTTAVAATQAALARLSSEIGIRETLGTTELNAQGHPVRIERSWFGAPDDTSDAHLWGATVDDTSNAMMDLMADGSIDNNTDLPSKAPLNWLSNARAPWIEYALPGELSRDHPRVPTFRGGRGAMFWYNPTRGVIRARVPESASDEASRALYAEVNGVDWE